MIDGTITSVDDDDFLMTGNAAGSPRRITIEDLWAIGGGGGRLPDAKRPCRTDGGPSGSDVDPRTLRIHDTLLLRLSTSTLGEETLQAILLELMDEVTESTSGVSSDRLMLANSALTSFKTIPLSSIAGGTTTADIDEVSWNGLVLNF